MTALDRDAPDPLAANLDAAANDAGDSDVASAIRDSRTTHVR
ncbi:hypothetical protein [Streptomyces sioyaensis]|nr:hypothetical protein [Streptomyces sioyaensis]